MQNSRRMYETCCSSLKRRHVPADIFTEVKQDQGIQTNPHFVNTEVTYQQGSVLHTCRRCSSFPAAAPKQYRMPSSPRQYIHSPLGDTQLATKSPPSRFPDCKDFTTCVSARQRCWTHVIQHKMPMLVLALQFKRAFVQEEFSLQVPLSEATIGGQVTPGLTMETLAAGRYPPSGTSLNAEERALHLI